MTTQKQIDKLLIAEQLRAAEALRQARIACVPIRTDGSKITSLGDWKRFQDPENLPRENAIQVWFGRLAAGIAAICGRASGGLECLDFDWLAEAIFAGWSKLVEAECPGLVSRLTVVRTPGDGYHVWYRCTEIAIPGNDKVAVYPADPNNPEAPEKDKTLIETRAEGGYALVPGGAPAAHQTGKPYLYHSGPPLPDVVTITAAEREILFQHAKSFDRRPPPTAAAQTNQRPASQTARVSPANGTSLRPGDDFEQRGPDWLEILSPHGWTLHSESGSERRWRRPGKDEPGYSATTGHCRGQDGADLLHVFSSNAAPFEVRDYGKFRAYALLNHNDDLSAAARDLAGQGYGDQRHTRNGQQTPRPASQQEQANFLATVLAQAQTDPAGAIAAALKGAELLTDVLVSEPAQLETLYHGLRQAGCPVRAIEGLRRAVNLTRRARRRRRPPDNPPTTEQTEQPPAVFFRNYREVEVPCENGDYKLQQVGLPIQHLHADLSRLSCKWPKRVGDLLFAPTADCAPLWLKSPTELFSWVSGLLTPINGNGLDWMRASDMVTEARLYAYLAQNAECFDAVEAYPHEPHLPRHYYLHPPVQGGEGQHLTKLLEFFCPASEIDADLLHTFFLSLVWGGNPGTRPVWLFTGPDGDKRGGRGVGKSTVAMLGGKLIGGCISANKDETYSDLVTRILSQDGLTQRVLLLDNLKSLKISWADMEALITAEVISGYRLYYGEGRRPNVLNIVLTINGASLSRDLAQRCVIVKMGRPTYSATWEADVKAYIETNRWAILGDIVAELQQPARTLEYFTRWSTWEHDVLARAALEPAEVQRVLSERQNAADDDQEESELVRDAIMEMLRIKDHDPDTSVVLIPSSVMTDWVNEATGEKRAKNKTTPYLKTLVIEELRKSDRADMRGWIWRGRETTANTQTVLLFEPEVSPFK